MIAVNNWVLILFIDISIIANKPQDIVAASQGWTIEAVFSFNVSIVTTLLCSTLRCSHVTLYASTAILF